MGYAAFKGFTSLIGQGHYMPQLNNKGSYDQNRELNTQVALLSGGLSCDQLEALVDEMQGELNSAGFNNYIGDIATTINRLDTVKIFLDAVEMAGQLIPDELSDRVNPIASEYAKIVRSGFKAQYHS